MSSVYLDGPNNSQMFTTCCDVAITDREDSCQRCKQDVEPRGHGARWSMAYGRIKRGGSYGNYRGIQDRPRTTSQQRWQDISAFDKSQASGGSEPCKTCGDDTCDGGHLDLR